MTVSEIHVGDIGTKILTTLIDDGEVVDLSSASSITYTFKKPSGTIVTKSGSLENDGTDGKVRYITEDGFLDGHGVWKYQVTVVIGSHEWSSDIGCFTVYKNINQ